MGAGGACVGTAGGGAVSAGLALDEPLGTAVTAGGTVVPPGTGFGLGAAVGTLELAGAVVVGAALTVAGGLTAVVARAVASGEGVLVAGVLPGAVPDAVALPTARAELPAVALPIVTPDSPRSFGPRSKTAVTIPPTAHAPNSTMTQP